MWPFLLVIVLSFRVGFSDPGASTLFQKLGSHNLFELQGTNSSMHRGVRCTPCESGAVGGPASNHLNPEYRGNGADNLGYDWSPMAWGGLAFPRRSKMPGGGRGGRMMPGDRDRNQERVHVICDTCRAYREGGGGGDGRRHPGSQEGRGRWQGDPRTMTPRDFETRVTSPAVGVLVRPGSRIAYVPSRSGEMYWDGVSGGGTRWDGFSNGISWIGGGAPEWDRSDPAPRERPGGEQSRGPWDVRKGPSGWNDQKGMSEWDGSGKGYYFAEGFSDRGDPRSKDGGYASNWHYGSTDQNGWNGSNTKWNYGGKQWNDNDRAANRFYFNSPQERTYGSGTGNHLPYGNRYPNYQPSAGYPAHFRPRPSWRPDGGHRVNDRDPSDFQSGTRDKDRPWDYTRPGPRPEWTRPGSNYSPPGDYEKDGSGKFPRPHPEYSPASDKNDYEKPWNGPAGYRPSKPDAGTGFPYGGSRYPGESGGHRPGHPGNQLFYPNDGDRRPGHPGTTPGAGGSVRPTYSSGGSRPGGYPSDESRPSTEYPGGGRPSVIYTGGTSYGAGGSSGGHPGGGSSSGGYPSGGTSFGGYPSGGSSSGSYPSGGNFSGGTPGGGGSSGNYPGGGSSSGGYPGGGNSGGVYPGGGSSSGGYPGGGGSSGNYPGGGSSSDGYPGGGSSSDGYPGGGNSGGGYPGGGSSSGGYPGGGTSSGGYPGGGRPFGGSSSSGYPRPSNYPGPSSGYPSGGGFYPSGVGRPDGYPSGAGYSGDRPYAYPGGGGYPGLGGSSYPSGVDPPAGTSGSVYPGGGSRPYPGESSGYPGRPGSYPTGPKYPSGGSGPGRYPNDRVDGYPGPGAGPLYPVRGQSGNPGPGGLYAQSGKHPAKGYYTGFITEIGPDDGYPSHGGKYPNYFGGSYPGDKDSYSGKDKNRYPYGGGDSDRYPVGDKDRYPTYPDDRYPGGGGGGGNYPSGDRGGDRFYYGQSGGKGKFPGGEPSDHRYPGGDRGGNSGSTNDKNSWNYGTDERKEGIYRRSGGSYPPYRGGQYYTSSYLASMTTTSGSTQETKSQGMTKVDEVTQPTPES